MREVVVFVNQLYVYFSLLIGSFEKQMLLALSLTYLSTAVLIVLLIIMTIIRPQLRLIENDSVLSYELIRSDSFLIYNFPLMSKWMNTRIFAKEISIEWLKQWIEGCDAILGNFSFTKSMYRFCFIFDSTSVSFFLFCLLETSYCSILKCVTSFWLSSIRIILIGFVVRETHSFFSFDSRNMFTKHNAKTRIVLFGSLCFEKYIQVGIEFDRLGSNILGRLVYSNVNRIEIMTSTFSKFLNTWE